MGVTVSNATIQQFYRDAVADLRELWQGAPDAGPLADLESGDPDPREAVLATLETFAASLQRVPENAARETLMGEVETVIGRLNALNDQEDGRLLGTAEARRIVPFVVDAVTVAGLDPELSPDRDPTLPSREWGLEVRGPSRENPMVHDELPLYRRPAAE